MPTEIQELQLRVSLLNDASAGVEKFKEELKQISGGEAKKQLDRLKAEQQELSKAVKELTELADGGTKALVGYIGKFGLAGAAFGGLAGVLAVGLYSLKEFADQMVDLTNKSKVIGVDPAVLKDIIEQYERLGVSSDETVRNVSGLQEALGEISRIGGERRMRAIQSAGAFGEQMEIGIQKVERQTTIQSKLNEILIQSQNVYDNRLKETQGNVADANKAENDFLKNVYNLDPSAKLLRHLDETTEERKKIIAARAKAAAEYKKSFTELGQEWSDFMEDMQASALKSDGVIIQGLQLALEIVKELRELWKEPWVKGSKKEGEEGSTTTVDLLKKVGVGGDAPASFDDRYGNWGDKPQPLLSAPQRSYSKDLGDGLAPGSSRGWEWMRRSENIEDRREIDQSMGQGEDYLKLIEANTVQVKKMNDNFKLLDQGEIELKGLGGGLKGFRYGNESGGSRGGDGGSPPVGPGSGRGAGDSSPDTGKGGGTSRATGASDLDPGGDYKGAGGAAGGVARGYETRKGERGEFNYAETGELGRAGTNITTIILKNGQKVRVNAAGAEKFKGLFNEMIDRGYKINSIGGYSYRGKAGGGGLSEHAWGSAVDVNPGRNAFRGRTTDMPSDVEELAWSHGVSWGGRFGDPMHFEIMSPEAAAHKRQILADRGLLDKYAGGGDKGVRTVKVQTTGTLVADINAPKGTDIKVEGGGAFNKTETNRTMPLDAN